MKGRDGEVYGGNEITVNGDKRIWSNVDRLDDEEGRTRERKNHYGTTKSAFTQKKKMHMIETPFDEEVEASSHESRDKIERD